MERELWKVHPATPFEKGPRLAGTKRSPRRHASHDALRLPSGLRDATGQGGQRPQTSSAPVNPRHHHPGTKAPALHRIRSGTPSHPSVPQARERYEERAPHSGQRNVERKGRASGSRPVPPHCPQPALTQSRATAWVPGGSSSEVRARRTTTPSPRQSWQRRLVDPGSARGAMSRGVPALMHATLRAAPLAATGRRAVRARRVVRHAACASHARSKGGGGEVTGNGAAWTSRRLFVSTPRATVGREYAVASVCPSCSEVNCTRTTSTDHPP